jgi:hypothetical protein
MAITKANDFVFSLKGEDGQNIVTEIRQIDGFINATKLCKCAGKQWNDYYRNKRTNAFLDEISSVLNIPRTDIIEIPPERSHAGTWVHPDVAVDLAAWCSPKFQVAVARLVRRYLSGELTTQESRMVAKKFTETNVLITDYDKKQVVYLGEVDTPEFKGIKTGCTDDIVRRVNEHMTSFGSFKVVKIFEALNNRYVEKKVLSECKALGVRTSCVVNGKSQTELIELSDSFTFDDLVKLIEKVIDSNIPMELEEKNKQIDDLKTDKTLLIEQEKTEQKRHDTRQLELQIELLNKLKEEEQERVAAAQNQIARRQQEVEELQQLQQQEQNAIDEMKLTYHERIQNAEDELKRLRMEEDSILDPKDELRKYIEEFCEFGEDKPTNRFRIPCNFLYEHYTKKIRVPLDHQAFKEYIKEEHNIDYRACNWNHHTEITWFGIRHKEFVNKKVSMVVQLIRDFVQDECVFGENYVEETKVLYNYFEKHSKDKGFDTIKQNGFSPRLFKTELLRLYPTLSIKEWAINGKKHGFAGIKLKTSPVQLTDAVRAFVEECCFKGLGYRTKSSDIYNAFNEFSKKKFETTYSKLKFYRFFREQNPELVEKYISQSERGFVGIILRSVLRASQNTTV